jgi:REP element-mobilizing transposase RayT
MSELRKAKGDGLYFVTLTVVGWIDIFSRKVYKDIIIENLQHCQQKEGLEIFAYVIMSNHVHLLIRRTDNDLGELLKRFKSYTSKKILTTIEESNQESRKDWLLYQFRFFANQSNEYGKYHFWQYTNHPTYLYTNEVIDQKRNYIHKNPVRAGIVMNEEDYIYSSACEYSPLKVLDL